MKTILPKLIGLVVLTAVASVIAVGAGTTADAGAKSCIDRTLRVGDRGSCVRYAQIMMNSVRYEERSTLGKPHYVKTDGSFGSKTKAQARFIQSHAAVDLKNKSARHRHVKLSKDGVIGKQTWAVLCSYSLNRVNKSAGCYKKNLRLKAFDYYTAIDLRAKSH